MKSAINEKLTITERLYRRNKELNVKLEQQKLESNIRIAEITEKYEEVKKMHVAVRAALKRENPLHPYLSAELIIAPGQNQDALRWRISAAPLFNWDDSTDSGMLRINVINGDTGQPECVGTCFSNKAFLMHESYIMDMVVEDITKTVARELRSCLENKIKQGLDDE